MKIYFNRRRDIDRSEKLYRFLSGAGTITFDARASWDPVEHTVLGLSRDKESLAGDMRRAFAVYYVDDKFEAREIKGGGGGFSSVGFHSDDDNFATATRRFGIFGPEQRRLEYDARD